ncbi:amidohydrolase [Bacillus solitudinis]|uniref:amidohydrolase n=1 Tax=Bacillus solitudinis TaxID=2014074 RepID=UPI000C235DDD|nr:amidohydrolase [Bacillus solitudinis]
MSLLCEDVTIVTMDENRPLIKKGYAYIEKGHFSKVEEGDPPSKLRIEAEISINAKGKWMLPGLINTHGHAGMTLLRGHADDLPLHQWLQEKIWPFEMKLDREAVRAGRNLALLEMIKSGTTTFLEMYHLFMDDLAETIEEVGIRATLMRSMIGLCPVEEQKEKLREAATFTKTWHKQANGRIQSMLAPHAPYTCPIRFIEMIVEEAIHLNVPVHMHLAETKKEVDDHILHHGLHPLDHLDQANLLHSVSWLFAHGVHLNDSHLSKIKEAKAMISHNPKSNLKLGSGIAPVSQMLDKEITVSLGTDSSASNNSLDMFEEMRVAALIHKGVEQSPTTLPAKMALELAMTNGAKALHFEKVGKIKEGYQADFLFIESTEGHLQPVEHVESHLVYACKSNDVTDVYVQGNALMKNRQVLTLDEERIISEANAHYQRIKALNS